MCSVFFFHLTSNPLAVSTAGGLKGSLIHPPHPFQYHVCGAYRTVCSVPPPPFPTSLQQLSDFHWILPTHVLSLSTTEEDKIRNTSFLSSAEIRNPEHPSIGLSELSVEPLGRGASNDRHNLAIQSTATKTKNKTLPPLTIRGWLVESIMNKLKSLSAWVSLVTLCRHLDNARYY